MNLTEILYKIKAVTGYAPRRSGKGWQCRCPSHEDRQASLSLSAGDDGRVLLHCHAGCEAESVVAALGLGMADLMPHQSSNGYAQRAAAKPPRTWATMDIAAKACCPPGHTLAATYVYSDSTRPQYAAVARYDGPNGKTIRPFRRVDGGWSCGDPPRWTPYHADAVARDTSRTVYVTEGEKCADAATAMGLLAVTSAHGASAASKTDWSSLAGRNVVILPDCDAPGERYATDVAGILHTLGCRIKIVRLSGLPEHGDIVDWRDAMPAEDRANAAATLRRLARAEPLWTPPESVVDTVAEDADDMPEPLPPRESFPVDALPPVVAAYVTAVATALPCAIETVALPLLAAIGSAIGNSRRVRPKASWSEPAVVWSCTVLGSGKLKSPAHEKAVCFLASRQRKLIAKYKQKMREFEAEKDQYEADKKRRKKLNDYGAEPPMAPEPPTCERLTTSDCTVEALASLLSENPRGVLLERDELSGWFASFDRYANGSGGDLAAFLTMHRAGALTVDRKTGTRLTHVDHAAVSICGTIQPKTLQRCLTEDFFDRGLPARFLFAMPDSPPRRWNENTISPGIETAMDGLFDRLLAIDLETKMDEDGNEYRVPIDLPLSAESKAVWATFYDDHAQEQESLDDDRAEYAWSKLEAYSVRFSLIFTLCRAADAGEIDSASMADAIRLTRWFCSETRRVYSMLSESPTQKQESGLIRLIRERFGGRVTPRELTRATRKYQPTEKAEAALEELVSAGRGKWEVTIPESGPGKPLQTFVLDDCRRVDSRQYSRKSAENANNVNVNTVNTCKTTVPAAPPEPPTQDAPPPEIAARLNQAAADAGGDL